MPTINVKSLSTPSVFLVNFFSLVWFQSEAQKQLEEIKALREKMKEVADEARGKEDIYKQLVMRGNIFNVGITNLFAFCVPNGIKRSLQSTGTLLLIIQLISYTLYVLHSACFQF